MNEKELIETYIDYQTIYSAFSWIIAYLGGNRFDIVEEGVWHTNQKKYLQLSKEREDRLKSLIRNQQDKVYGKIMKVN